MTTLHLTAPDAKTLARCRAWPLIAVLVCASFGCDALPANPRRPQLLTLGDLETLAAQDPAATFANDAGVPGGLRIKDYVKQGTDGFELVARDTWTETYHSAYVTAEIWTGFDEVWVQPVYVPVTGLVDGAPVRLAEPGKGWSPIFSVGPASAFYSPFWRTFYFQVPAGTDAGTYKSARDVVDSGLPLVEGPGRTMSLVPTGAAVPVPRSEGLPNHGSGYLDGAPIEFLDFGADTFTWNDDLVVDETPLFVLVYRDDAGHLQPLNVPTVAGTGPLYANRPPNVVDDVPRYGAYWRLYTVVVPPGARIFAPPQLAAASVDYPTSLVADHYGADILAAPAGDVGTWLGRVALNALPAADSSTQGCFDSYKNLDPTAVEPPQPCQFLDSQPAIEKAVGTGSIQKTDILVTCPFVLYNDATVPVTP